MFLMEKLTVYIWHGTRACVVSPRVQGDVDRSVIATDVVVG